MYQKTGHLIVLYSCSNRIDTSLIVEVISSWNWSTCLEGTFDGLFALTLYLTVALSVCLSVRLFLPVPVEYELQTLGPGAAHTHLFAVMLGHLLLSALHTSSRQESFFGYLVRFGFSMFGRNSSWRGGKAV